MDLKKHDFHVEKSLELKINRFIADLKNKRSERNNWQAVGKSTNSFHCQNPKIGAIVMNCNPFTYGHQYLIETAARLVNLLYIFVVEEDKSIFPFSQRY